MSWLVIAWKAGSRTMPEGRSSVRVASTRAAPAFSASPDTLPEFCQRCSAPSQRAVPPPMPCLRRVSAWLSEELTSTGPVPPVQR